MLACLCNVETAKPMEDIMAKENGLAWQKGDTDFSDPKLKKAYAEMHKAFEKAAEVRENIVNPAVAKFDGLYKAALVKRKVHSDPAYLRVSHRFGLAFAVADEPQEQQSSGRKARREAFKV